MQKRNRQEEIAKRAQKLLEERGRRALEMGRKEILEEEIECKEVSEALSYFMTEYWRDLDRPTLLSLCCEAVGGDPDATTPVAVPLSLISGGIDIHDDIIDQSKIKDGRPTVYGKFGKEIALLVGDSLLFKGFALLYDLARKGVPTETVSFILNVVKEMFFELGDAEALELRFRGRVDVTPEKYLDVVRKKAADAEALVRVSAFLGGGSEEELEKIGVYGRLLGMILILRDDMLDTTDFAETLHRIKNECLPLPILYALQDTERSPRLVSIICKRPLTKRDMEEIQEITAESLGLKRTQKIVNDYAGKASSAIQEIDKKGNLKAFVVAACIPYLEEETI